jgi:hypothetical protein
MHASFMRVVRKFSIFTTARGIMCFSKCRYQEHYLKINPSARLSRATASEPAEQYPCSIGAGLQPLMALSLAPCKYSKQLTFQLVSKLEVPMNVVSETMLRVVTGKT